MKRSKVLVVGNRGGTNVGEAFEKAASDLDVDIRLIESRLAMEASPFIRRANWWLRGRRPTRLGRFSQAVAKECHDWRPDYVVATGIAPLSRRALADIGKLGVRRIDYLTDDPWNPSHRAPWFMDALRQYDWIFSPRTSNLDDLRKHGCPRVSYLPFAYTPDVHYCDKPETVEEQKRFAADIVFAGGADPDRVALVGGLVRSGFQVALYGDYWDRHLETRYCALGQADPKTLRKATTGAKVVLCLVRRANRDGNTMRTFEASAMGACMLTEYTEEHRQILGEDGDAVVYFRSHEEMIARLHWLLAHDEERHRLSAAVRARVTRGRNTYKDRLETMLAVATDSGS